MALEVPTQLNMTPVSWKDVEKLLEMAEQLEEKYQQSKLRLDVFFAINRTFQTGFICCVVFLMVNFNHISMAGLGSLSTLVGLFFGVMLGTFQLLFLRITQRVHELVERDKAAFEAMIELLREIDPRVMQFDPFPALERAEFRIRMARFDIAPSKNSKT